jgi:TRAP transporter 4TM/12TM fusion protein
MEPVQPISVDEEREELVTEEDLKKAEKFVEEDEGLIETGDKGFFSKAIGVAAVIMSLYHLYAAVGIITPHILRATHLGFVVCLTFLVFPVTRKFRGKIFWFDICFALLSLVPIIYLIFDFEDFIYRAITPTAWDIVLGIMVVLFVLETNRRATGIVMPLVAVCFIAYAVIGPVLPKPWTHRGYDVERIVGHLYMTLEGIFGIPIDVSSTFIILFTIFGAFLQFSNAGKFYVDFSFALMKGKPSAPGRTVTLASFLLGGPSGSGTATTVTLGAFAWPMLAKAGYPREVAGGLLSAGGIGAILSPPVLGAAAFLIAELLKISYLEVMWMATVPTLLYYWSIFLMVEFDAKKFGTKKIEVSGPSAGELTKMYWYHFLSLGSIVGFMLIGLTAIMSVFLSTVLCFLTSFLRKDTALYPRKLIDALKNGSMSVLSVATTCACAGIIVGIVTLTGLGMKFSSIILYYAEGSLLLTTIYCALIIWVIGLAVPVTATYIVAVVMVAPALIMLGVPDYAAHMFVFYYAVLSEVTPPTALSPFAAAAICKGNPYTTTVYAWKYTLPAFLFPFTFVLDPSGVGILLKGPLLPMVWTVITAFIGIFALASGASRWLLVQANIIETTLLITSGLLLVYPSGSTDVAGIIMLVLVILLQIVRKKKILSALFAEKTG